MNKHLSVRKIFSARQKYYPIISVLTLLVSTIIFWHPLVFQKQTLFFDLTTRYFFPMMTIFKQAIRSMQYPFWNPFVFSGIPLAANPQAGAFYPFTYLFVFFEFPTALTSYVVLHTFLAGFLMYCLSRRFSMKHLSAITSAFLYMFGGFFILHTEFINNIGSYAWLPAILLYFDKTISENDVQNLIFTSVLLTLQFLAGMPEFSYLTLLVLLLYFIAVNPSISDKKKLANDFLKKVLPLMLLFLAFSAVQILPALELIKQSVRGAGMNISEITTYSVRPLDFIRFLVYPLWTHSRTFWQGDVHVIGFYFGLISIALVISGLFIKKISRKQKFFLALFLVFSVLSLGKYIPYVYKAVCLILPGFGSFRFPAQLLFVASFAFPLMAGLSLEKISNKYIKLSFLMLIFVELFFFGAKANLTVDRSYYKVQTENLCALKSDSALFRFMLDPALEKEAPRNDNDKFKFWLNYKDMLYPNTAAAYNLFYASGYETLELRSYEAVINKISGASSKILDMLNVKYLMTKKNLTDPKFRIVKNGETKIYLNKNALPRFFFVDRAKYLPKDGMSGYMSGKDFNPAKEVLLDKTLENSFNMPPEESKKILKTYSVIEGYKMNEIELLTASVKSSWLVTSEVNYPGWKVTIDGNKAALLNANYAFRSVFVPRGSHRVRFYYRPVVFGIGMAISILSLFGVLIAEAIGAAILWRKWSKNPSLRPVRGKHAV